MIAEAGLAALWLAAALALLQFALACAGNRLGELRALIGPVAIAQGLLAVFSFAMLVWLFVRTDTSVALVVSSSHSDKPWIYRVTGTWGNHEGSMLLWVMVLAAAGALLAMTERRLRPETLRATLNEVDVIARLKAALTVFMLGEDPRLEAFVDLVARRSGGRVVAPDLDGLGAAVVSDYLHSRRR